MHQGDLKRSNAIRRQAIQALDEKRSVARIQESVGLRVWLKEDPVTTINFVGDLSVANNYTRLKLGELWLLVGNYQKANEVFETIVADNSSKFYTRRAQYYISNALDDVEKGNRLYSIYQLVADKQYGTVATIYAQERENKSFFLHNMVVMLHQLNAYNSVFTEYLKIMK